MTLEEMDKNARQLYNDGFHCSQAVFYTGLEKLGMSSPEVLAALSPFGGGMGSTGSICGCLPGALAVLGLVMGKKRPSDRDHKLMWKYAYRLVRRFEELTRDYGGKECRDIARVNWKDRKQVKAYYRNGPESRKGECLKVMGATSRILGEILEEIAEPLRQEARDVN